MRAYSLRYLRVEAGLDLAVASWSFGLICAMGFILATKESARSSLSEQPVWLVLVDAAVLLIALFLGARQLIQALGNCAMAEPYAEALASDPSSFTNRDQTEDAERPGGGLMLQVGTTMIVLVVGFSLQYCGVSGAVLKEVTLIQSAFALALAVLLTIGIRVAISIARRQQTSHP